MIKYLQDKYFYTKKSLKYYYQFLPFYYNDIFLHYIFEFIELIINFLPIYLKSIFVLINTHFLKINTQTTSSPCCVEDSHCQYIDLNYQYKGSFKLIDNFECYFTPIPKNTLKGIIIIFPDIFGPFSGRHTQIADYLYQQDYYAICPDILGPKWQQKNFKLSILSNLFNTLREISYFSQIVLPNHYQTELKFIKIMTKIINNLKLHNIQIQIPTIAIGFCSGTYYVTKLLTYLPEDNTLPLNVQKGICFHPHLILSSGSPRALIDKVIKPLVMVSAQNDPYYFHPSGDVSKNLIKKFKNYKSFYKLFNKMKHGWMVRSPLDNQQICEDYQKGLQLIIDFIDFNK